MENYNVFYLVLMAVAIIHVLVICGYHFFTFHVPYKKYVSFFVAEAAALLFSVVYLKLEGSMRLQTSLFWPCIGIFGLICTTYIALLPMIIVPGKSYIMSVTGKIMLPERGTCLIGTIVEHNYTFTVILEGYPYAYELHNRVELMVKLKQHPFDREYYHTPVVTFV